MWISKAGEQLGLVRLSKLGLASLGHVKEKFIAGADSAGGER